MKTDDPKEPSGCMIAMFITAVVLCFISLPVGLVAIFFLSIIGNIQSIYRNKKRAKLERNKPEPNLSPIVQQPKASKHPDYSKCFELIEEEGVYKVVYIDDFGAAESLFIANIMSCNISAYSDTPTLRRVKAIGKGNTLLHWRYRNFSMLDGHSGVISAPESCVFRLNIAADGRTGLDLRSLPKGAVIAESIKGADYAAQIAKQMREDYQRSEERMKQHKAEQEESERKEIAEQLLEKQRKRDLEKQVRQDLIDSGQLYGDELKRPRIPEDVKNTVYRRDGGKCVYCGSTQNLQYDHIIPFSKGGATSVENLQILCQKCNLEKSNKIG